MSETRFLPGREASSEGTETPVVLEERVEDQSPETVGPRRQPVQSDTRLCVTQSLGTQ